MEQLISKPVRFLDGDGFLHGFSTGRVSVKSRFRTAKGGQYVSKINFLMDNKWTEYMPIMVWVIDHPEGLFVVDTGENAKVSEPDYFKQEGLVLNYINTRSFKFKVCEEEEVGNQLERLGYQQRDISKVILTHLHLDHFDGLHYFDKTEILVNRLEWQKPSFALPSLYPKWFRPRLVDLNSTDNQFFSHYASLTKSGEIVLVHTPGHTLGHCSVLVKSRELHYMLAGDVTYDQNQLINNINAGGHQHFRKSLKTICTIKNYSQVNKLVYLPSHDNDVFVRLRNDLYLK